MKALTIAMALLGSLAFATAASAGGEGGQPAGLIDGFRRLPLPRRGERRRPALSRK